MIRIAGAALAVGLVLSGWSSSVAALEVHQPGGYDFVTAEVYSGPVSDTMIAPTSFTGSYSIGTDGIATLVDGTATFQLPSYNGLQFIWLSPSGSDKACTDQTCLSSSLLDSSANYLIEGGGKGARYVELMAGDDPFRFSTIDLVPTPLPASLPMFGGALLAMIALAYGRKVRGAR